MELQIREYIENDDNISYLQSASRAGQSFSTAGLSITIHITISLDRNKFTAFILTDYNWTFDTVDHDVLCAVLYCRVCGMCDFNAYNLCYGQIPCS